MRLQLKEGIKGQQEIMVEVKDTAANVGSGTVEVFATPSMIALMENTAQASIAECLAKGEATVGIEINIKHIKATPVGVKVKCFSELTEVKGKKLLFKVEAFDEKGKIGEGKHIRYIIDTEKFMENVK
ncbi:thioesterase family protein [Clostridium grantii]|uniref:Thioesterase superfamily n=1 Tax=Clostridium grantii DSM 8605 TaxID=1121316 RepID=A0A1M5XY26_9CLOT|nr:thioesterase family protein [Clostridium grantii]SHI04727.1 Thioesterase superfamily [Clostridium grantii DSM 8605]